MSPWDDIAARCAELARLRSASATLQWDQLTMMPAQGAAGRGQVLGLLATLMHERVLDPALSDALDAAAETELDAGQAAAVRLLRRQITRYRHVPADLVAERSEATSAAYPAWLQAKADNDPSVLEGPLTRVFAIERATAQAIDSSRHPYDVLLEAYEPTATHVDLQRMFARLAPGITPLIEATRDRPVPPLQHAPVPTGIQRRLHDELVTAMGFDTTAGRVDTSEHPFTVGIGPGDVRITLHLYDDDVLMGLGGTIHEAGHALYEQGIPRTLAGTGVDEAASTGLHESQSRLWENFIGRSRPFCGWIQQRIAHHLDLQLDAEALYRAANPVVATPVRIFADEATYNLHIQVRFELELALLTGDLRVADLPGAWNDAYERLLGIRPPNHTQGCLQDVHWPSGAIAYFPTYTIGNLHAASLGAALQAELPDLWTHVGQGQFGEVLAWLRDRVHRHGHALETPDILRAAVGERDGVDDLVHHLWTRHGALHGVTH